MFKTQILDVHKQAPLSRENINSEKELMVQIMALLKVIIYQSSVK